MSPRHPDPDDAPTKSSQITSAQLQADLLFLIASGPRFKFELNRLTEVNEVRLLEELAALRKRGVVTLDKAKRWCLASAVAKKATPPPAPKKKHRLPRPLVERYPEFFK